MDVYVRTASGGLKINMSKWRLGKINDNVIIQPNEANVNDNVIISPDDNIYVIIQPDANIYVCYRPLDDSTKFKINVIPSSQVLIAVSDPGGRCTAGLISARSSVQWCLSVCTYMS